MASALAIVLDVGEIRRRHLDKKYYGQVFQPGRSSSFSGMVGSFQSRFPFSVLQSTNSGSMLSAGYKVKWRAVLSVKRILTERKSDSLSTFVGQAIAKRRREFNFVAIGRSATANTPARHRST